MLGWRRTAMITGGLLLLTVVLSMLGVTQSTWRRLSGAVLPWQREHALEPATVPEAVVELRERNARLNARVVELEARLAAFESIIGEGGVDPLEIVVAVGRVIGRSRRSGRSLVEIDVGGVDRVRQGMACLSGWSLVGMVVGEDRERSLVRLITDPESRIPAALYSLQGDFVGEGLLVGDPAVAGCRLLYIDDHPDLELAEGMEVLTSGTGGRLPPGLVLGQVDTLHRPAGDDHWDITVRPLRRVEHLGRLQIADVARLRQNGSGD